MLGPMLFSLALLDGALVTVKLYVCVVVPFCAVTTVLITVWVPSASAIGPDAEPELTTAPFTFIVAWVLVVVGVTVKVAVVLITLAV